MNTNCWYIVAIVIRLVEKTPDRRISKNKKCYSEINYHFINAKNEEDAYHKAEQIGKSGEEIFISEGKHFFYKYEGVTRLERIDYKEKGNSLLFVDHYNIISHNRIENMLLKRDNIITDTSEYNYYISELLMVESSCNNHKLCADVICYLIYSNSSKKAIEISNNIGNIMESEYTINSIQYKYQCLGITSFLPVYENVNNGSELLWDKKDSKSIGSIVKQITAKNILVGASRNNNIIIPERRYMSLRKLVKP